MDWLRIGQTQGLMIKVTSQDVSMIRTYTRNMQERRKPQKISKGKLLPPH